MSKNNLQYFLLGLILLVHAFILTKVIFFPYPELFIYPYLTNHGLKPYTQILDQHFPGLMFLPINFDNLGMNNEAAARVWLIGVVIITHLLLFFIARHLFKSSFKALLVNLLYLVWQPFFEGWVLWIDNFLPLILLPAFYVLYKRKFLITGILLGLGIVLKQTIIPLSIFVLIYMLLTKRDFKTVLFYLLGLFIPVGLTAAYLVGIGVFWDFWYWTVIFNLTIYAKFGRGEGPTLAHFSRVLLVFGSSLLVIRGIKLREVQILLIFLAGTLLGLSTRFDFVHFQPALPFALIAFVYSFKWLNKFLRWSIIVIYGLTIVWWLAIFYRGHIGNRIVSFDSNTMTLAAKVRSYTRPGDRIFVFGGEPQLYQMSKTLPAGNIFVFQFPWFYKVAEGRVLEGIKQDEPGIIVADKTMEIEGVKIIDFARDIDQYIQSNYQRIDNVGTAEILKRK